MADCVMTADGGQWYCTTHQIRMDGGLGRPPLVCTVGHPLTQGDRAWLQKEQRRLGYRILTGTLTKADRERLADIKAKLAT